MKQIKTILQICFCLLLTTGCNESTRDLFDPLKPDNIDPRLDLTREDYRSIHDAGTYAKPGDPAAALNPAEPPVPELEEILAAPQPPKIGATKLVSVAVTDDVPLKDVLIELARLADIDIEVDAGISGGVSFRAKDRPFNEVIERIADLAGLRYTMKNGVLRVERDTPYVQTYNLDFLNFERTGTSSMSINTGVLSTSVGGGGGGSGEALSSSSTVSLTSDTKSDFWQQFDEGVKSILAYVPSSRVSATTIAAQPALPSDPSGEEGPPVIAAPVQAAATAESYDGFYIINKEASTLTISATGQQHEMIRIFLDKVRSSVSSQVLIEAKIVEVTLNDKFQSGIDWSRLGGSKVSLPFQFGAVDDPANVATFSFVANDLTGFNIDLQAAVQLAENFGTTRTLSSPRLHAMNNQQAVLTFAENTVYFEIAVESDTTTTTTGPTTSVNVTSTIHTVPIGIILALQPSINMESQEVTLSVRPTLSRITGFVNDPAVAFLLSQLPTGAPTAGLNSPIPIVEVRELDSILKLQSGQVMVIGGLMEEKALNNDTGVPWVDTVPVVGNLFKGVDRQRDVKELVIFIRATIVGSHGNAHTMDKAVYDKYTRDPRPLKF